MLPIFEKFNAGKFYFLAQSSVTGHDLDVKVTVYLALRKDNRNFYARFMVCKNFPYQAIIGANFLKSQ